MPNAIDLDPEYASAWSLLAGLHFHIEEDGRYSGEERKQALQSTRNYVEQAIDRQRKAMRLCLVYPLWFLSVLGQVLRVLGRTEEAIGAYTEMVEHYPDFSTSEYVGNLTNIT